MGKWEEIQIDKLFKIRSGNFIKRKDISENKEFPVFGGNGITGYAEDFNLEGENIIIGRVGAKCGNVRFIKEKIWLTDNAFYISEYFEEFDKQFLKLFLEHYNLGSTANQAAQPVISYKGIKEIKIPLPPLPEQQRIVTKLDGLFAKIDKAIGLLEENIAHTQALMGSVLDEIYSDGDIMLKDVCILGPKKSEVRDLDDNLEVSFLPMRDLNEHDINFVPNEIKKISEVYKGYTYFADGDIILAKVTPCFENGKAGLAKKLTNGIGFGSSEYHVLRPKENVLPEWIYFSVLTEQIRVTGKENMTGAGGLKRIPRPFLEEWKIPVPELSIQKKQIKRIVQIQEETKSLETSIQEKLNHLKSLKSSLLDQAFKGEL
ncbi:restriction endonuclease subunit S [Polaribacter vadi]|uniref:restriction endonuclease subunit S n=1 Tax=Polaribacter TaxID=52959 RepID=UPI001C08D227|nr:MULTISPECIES: restriction endonuclease subunit S [Polaribacter]MBU3012267.1 restriction endonuclease subunit S [Polaribacter vadi]MDO6742084.1 restriction endonuclease subunit S [Polaribacter sp. 1_MG-2023]